jgi:uncharacterized membrane protein
MKLIRTFTDTTEQGEMTMSKKRKKHASAMSTSPQDVRAAKKAAVLGAKTNNRHPLIAILICCLLAIGGGVYYMMNGPDVSASKEVEQVASSETPAPQTPTMFAYPVSDFIDGLAKHFHYQHGNITIRYFILRSHDGVIWAAFDACDVCWPAGKGYYQDGDHMVCRNCGRRFASIMVNEVQGGCNPAPLTRTRCSNVAFFT